MKSLRFLYTSLVTAGILLLPAGAVLAQTDVLNDPCKAAPNSQLCVENSKTNNQTLTNNSLTGPKGLLTRAAFLIAIIAGMAGVIMMVIGGMRYVLAAGDNNAIQTAKRTILFAIVGLVVAAMAEGIALYVLSKI